MYVVCIFMHFCINIFANCIMVLKILGMLWCILVQLCCFYTSLSKLYLYTVLVSDGWNAV